jgi:hypothetical protein
LAGAEETQDKEEKEMNDIDTASFHTERSLQIAPVPSCDLAPKRLESRAL